MRFSVITPTLQRESLLRTCASIDSQSHTDWQHVVMIDCDTVNEDILTKISHPQRLVLQCPSPHRNFGNSCRRNAWEHTKGDYVLHTDDDNFLADENIFKDMAHVLKDSEKDWALFPILRHGQWFYTDPPRTCHVDTANMVIRREFAQWPDGPEYTMDGIFCERLVRDHEYDAYPHFRPIVVMPSSSEGI